MTHEQIGAGVSIVVPSHNDAKYLERLLGSLDRIADEGPWELIVVDDSKHVQAERVAELCAAAHTRFLHVEGNLSVKRNRGVANAVYDLIFFVDADCEVTSGVLRRHRALLQRGPEVGALCGAVEFTGEKRWLWPVIERTQYVGAFAMARRMPYAPWAATCNLSVRRANFMEIGGFDESWGNVPAGEDVDFGLRLNQAGYKIACDGDAVILHTRDTWHGVRRMVRRAFNYGRNHLLILTRHAEQTSLEYPRLAVIFLSLLLLQAIAAIAWQSIVPLVEWALFVTAVLVVQAVLVARLSRRPIREIPLILAAHIFDLVFDVGLAFASLRQRATWGLVRKIVYAQGQLYAERDRKVVQCWSLFLVLAVIVLV